MLVGEEVDLVHRLGERGHPIHAGALNGGMLEAGEGDDALDQHLDAQRDRGRGTETRPFPVDLIDEHSR